MSIQASNLPSVQNAPSSAVIFGGAGFIGTHLARQLLEQGCSVTTVDILPRHDKLDVKHVIRDVRESLPTNLARCPDVIFNLAAVHRTPGHPDRDYYDTNVGGALNVVDWATAVGADSLCFTSSISVYGPGEDLKTESTAPAPSSPYGKSKYMAEQIHLKWSLQSSGRSLRIIRPAVIFGPNENGNFTRLAGALRQRRFLYPGRDDTLKSCGYVRDLVRAFFFSLNAQSQIETFNYCYPTPSTIRDICEAFHNIAGYPQPKTIPRAPLEMPLRMAGRLKVRSVSHLADRIKKLTISTNVHPTNLINAGFKWETSLVTGIEEWYDACDRRIFE